MLHLAFYADDFTGSTDALESLARAGLSTALFLQPPTPEQLARQPGLEAVGVAGVTRSLAPAAMAAELRPAFAALQALAPRHVHYKVCSTFDSSPTVGSIGRAIEVGREIFCGRYTPLLVGAPGLGRYCVFGNLFARMGIGSAGQIHRLDRHPSMSRHPVTPADESDLRRHLARQTALKCGLVDILAIAAPADETHAALDAQVAAGAQVVLFDVLYPGQLARIGGLIETEARPGCTVFSVGSSGIGSALTAQWTAGGLIGGAASFPVPGPAAPLLVVSGSCSPVTAGQIAWARSHGFACFSLDPSGREAATVLAQAEAALRAGQSAVIATSEGGAAGPVVPAADLGTRLGRMARELAGRTGLRRLVVAGGDTSGYAGRALGIEALTMIAPLTPGAPLCRALAPGSPADGIEIAFKGGQVGAPDYFGAVARGAP